MRVVGWHIFLVQVVVTIVVTTRVPWVLEVLKSVDDLDSIGLEKLAVAGVELVEGVGLDRVIIELDVVEVVLDVLDVLEKVGTELDEVPVELVELSKDEQVAVFGVSGI